MLATLKPNRWELAVGLTLLALGPLLLISGAAKLFPALQSLAILAFVVGWLLAAGGLRPGGDFRAGVKIGTIAYMAVGLVWAIGFNYTLGKTPGELLIGLPALLLIGAIWPMQVLQAFGLFGFELG